MGLKSLGDTIAMIFSEFLESLALWIVGMAVWAFVVSLVLIALVAVLYYYGLRWLFLLVALLLCIAALFDRYALSSIASWKGVAGKVEGAELEQLKSLVKERCEAARNKYNFSLELVDAFRVHCPALEQRFDEFCEAHGRDRRASNRQKLFHGTPRESARSILSSGFRLPEKGGMFGKGVYFASAPLKSFQYARGDGTILLCEVALGKTMKTYHANNSLEPERDLSRNWFLKALGMQNFDSVTASSGPLGCVRVPEYVVYKTEQAVPRYLLVTKQTRKSS